MILGRSFWPIRLALDADLQPLAHLWHDGWHEAHAAYALPEITAYRTLDRFVTRVAALGDHLRTAGPVGEPLGLCVTDGDYVDQLYASPLARGTGLAAALLSDGEARLSASGVTTARLNCAEQNTRARRFYTRQGWVDRGTEELIVDVGETAVPISIIRFTKSLSG